MKTVTDLEIVRTFNLGVRTPYTWKKDLIKFPNRYQMYKDYATLIKNNINIYDIFSMSEKIVRLEAENKKLKDDIEEMLSHVRGITR